MNILFLIYLWRNSMRKLIACLCLSFGLCGAIENIDFKHAAEMRRYDLPVTPDEKKDIRYIITYLSDKSLITLLRHKSSLEDAGDRINHVHPLRFLMCVFTDDELTSGIRGIYKRGGWVWSDFVHGLKESLKEEHQRNNLRDDQVVDFSKEIEMESSAMFSSIHNKKWNDFVIFLIKNVNR